MAIKVDVRKIDSSRASELYITATPTSSVPVEAMWQELFNGVREALVSNNAHIIQERMFATQDAIELAPQIRADVYGDIDDGVAPSYLVCKEGLGEPIAGIQIHAIKCGSVPEVITLNGEACGRIVELDDRKYLTLSAILDETSSTDVEQSKVMLQKAEEALKLYNTDLLSVARTWMWLGDILKWYDDFNRVRNELFTKRGLIGSGSRQSMPASTGIGLGPSNGSFCSMDLAAILEPANSNEYIQVIGKQQCASDYGSAFSRAAKAMTPAAETIFISGTASIDEAGATTNIDDPVAQVKTTIVNVQAVLKDLECGDEDVVQVMAYCKTTEVEKVFNSLKDELPWPWVTMVCDVCRDDLLFEIEAVAIVPQK
jgi:enamine deaminase RidA (YjgF/YER057c/UK114 family)